MASLRQSISNLFGRKEEAEVEAEALEEQASIEGNDEEPKRRGKRERRSTKNNQPSMGEEEGEEPTPTQPGTAPPEAAFNISPSIVEAQLVNNNAEEPPTDPNFLQRLTEGATKSAQKVGGKVLLLRDMLEMHAKGVHPLQAWEVAVIVSCLVYVLNPIDLILDTLPGGFADDVLVLGAAVHRLDATIHGFEAWKAAHPEEFERGKEQSWFGGSSSQTPPQEDEQGTADDDGDNHNNEQVLSLQL